MEKKNIKNSNTTSPFILVSDKLIADNLKESGFVCVSETESMFTFINDGKLLFSDDIDIHKIAFTNMLCI